MQNYLHCSIVYAVEIFEYPKHLELLVHVYNKAKNKLINISTCDVVYFYLKENGINSI
jgi:hypothetical protein